MASWTSTEGLEDLVTIQQLGCQRRQILAGSGSEREAHGEERAWSQFSSDSWVFNICSDGRVIDWSSSTQIVCSKSHNFHPSGCTRH